MVDVILVTVTVISLAFASAMGLITWRVLRQERRRSDARVADLCAAADADDDAVEELAAAMPACRDARPQVPAVTTFEADAGPLWTDLVAEHVTETTPRPNGAPRPELFVPPEPMRSNGRRMVLAVGLGAAMVLVVFAVVLGLNAKPGASATHAVAAARVAAPLELVVLDHARTGGRLSIHGLVRNPRTGTAVRDLSAVVFLFDRDGAYIATVQAPVLEHDLVPGGESSFEVPVESGQRVARYRLTFRVAAAPVPHVDRRAPVPAAAPAVTRASVVARATLATTPADGR